MSTITTLVSAGELVNFGRRLVDGGVLDPSEMPERQLYATPKFVEWYEQKLPNIPVELIDASDRDWRKRAGGMLRPKEQVVTLLGAYVAGQYINDDDLKPMKNKRPAPPLPSEVVEWRTAHMRMFGCFARVDCAVLVTLGCEKRWLRPNITNNMIGEVRRWITDKKLSPVKGSYAHEFVN